MCYIIAKHIDEVGCVALKTTHGIHLSEFKRSIEEKVGYEKIQLVTISRPSAYGEYMQYSIELGIKAPQFVIHDKMENTHINQLKTIFEICEKIDGQYIIPILRERIDKINQEYIEKAKILELSTTDKFFCI